MKDLDEEKGKDKERKKQQKDIIKSERKTDKAK